MYFVAAVLAILSALFYAAGNQEIRGIRPADGDVTEHRHGTHRAGHRGNKDGLRGAGSRCCLIGKSQRRRVRGAAAMVSDTCVGGGGSYRNTLDASAALCISSRSAKKPSSNQQRTAEQLTIVTGCDVHEPDGTKASATPWPTRLEFGLGSSMTQAKICTSNDMDNFFLKRYGGSAPSIQMTPPAGTDYELILLDSTGTVVQRSSLVGSVMETVNIPVGLVQFFVRVRSQDGTFSARAAYRLELLP